MPTNNIQSKNHVRLAHKERLRDAGTTLSRYMQEISKPDLLTAEQEKELARRIRKGDEVARQQFIEANLRLVVHVARRYAPQGDPEALLDLIQEGNLGLFRAVERFDPDKGSRFSTYGVYWIRQAITRYLARKDVVRLPENVMGDVYRMRTARHRLYQALGRQPTTEELALELGLTIKQLMRLEEYSQAVISLDQPIKGKDAEDETTLGEIVRDLDAPQPEFIAGQHLLRAQVREVLDSLPARERSIISKRFGIDDGVPRTLEEIGEEFGVSRERIRQIQNSAFQRIRERAALKKN